MSFSLIDPSIHYFSSIFRKFHIESNSSGHFLYRCSHRIFAIFASAFATLFFTSVGGVVPVAAQTGTGDWSATVPFGLTYRGDGPEIAAEVYIRWTGAPTYFVTWFNGSSAGGVYAYYGTSTSYSGTASASVSCLAGFNLRGHCVVNSDIQAMQSKAPNSCPVAGKHTPGPLGNPVEPVSGAKLESHTDFSTNGPDPLKFERFLGRRGKGLWFYGNRDQFGLGWRSNFDLRADPNNAVPASSTQVYVTLADGRDLLFQKTGLVWAPASLNVTASGISFIANRKGVPERISVVGSTYELVTEDDNVHVFDAAGKLVEIRYSGGYTQTISYNAQGFKQTVSDNRGRSLGFVYNSTGMLAELNAPGGLVYQYSYAARPGLSSYAVAAIAAFTNAANTNPWAARGSQVLTSVKKQGDLNPMVSYLYEDGTNPGRITGIVDGRNVRLSTYAYDSSGRTTLSEHTGSDLRHTFAYNPASNNITITNPGGKQAIYSYVNDAQNNRLLMSIQGQASANCPLSNSSFTWDANNYLASVTDEEGRVTGYVNNARGLPTSIVRGSGTAQAVTTSITWHANWRLPTQVVEPGLTTNFIYDTSGRLITLSKVDTAPSGQTRTWTYTYGTGNLLLSVDGPLSGTGDTVTYTYNANGYLATVTNEMGKVTTVNAVNGRGQPTQITDANGVVTNLVYETARGLLTSMTIDPTGTPASTTIEYDAAGQVTKVIQPDGSWTSYTWNAAHRLTLVTNNVGETITYTRDAFGNATSTVMKRANATTAYSNTKVFDELGRVIRSLGAVAATSQYDYTWDKSGNLKTVKDPRTLVVSTGYDALNRVISETNEENAAVTLTRNGTDDIVNYQDPRNLSTVYVRNGFGEVIQETSPDRGTTVYVRDSRGLVTQTIDARGQVINSTYDNAGRLTGKTYPATPSRYLSLTWDAVQPDNKGVGRLVGISDESGITWRGYDSRGYVWVDYRTNYPAPAKAVNYTRDAAGNVLTMTYPSGRIVTYSRDAAGRISSINTKQNSGAAVVTVASALTWQPFGGIASIAFGNGVTATYTSDTDYRITGINVYSTAMGTVLNRTYGWIGDFLMSVTDGVTPTLSQTYTYLRYCI